MTLPGDWREHLPELLHCQPWGRYYHFRAGEMEVVNALCPLPRGDSMLELGCGNAFHSYLLAGRFRTVIATDLMQRDSRTHTIGLERAQALARILNVENLRIVGASAESLPFVDESVDFVFSSNVLEHLSHKQQAVREIYRVLRPGGQCLTIVPAAMERVYNLPVSYILILHALARGLHGHFRRRMETDGVSSSTVSGDATAGSSRGSATAPPNFWRKARRFFHVHFPGFPFPNPHGEYRSSTQEFLAHRPATWLRLFESESFQIERSFTTILAPHTLGMAISPGLAYWFAWAGWPLTRVLGHRSGFKRLGTSFGLLATRPAMKLP